VIRSRTEILKEIIIKWGSINVIVTSSDPEKFGMLEEFFDIIVVDAPCSGEGLFRKDAKAVNEWSQENVNLCSLRQKRILNNVWPALKPGGHLIYSTCTFQPKENEQQLASFIKEFNANSVDLTTDKKWNIEITETPAGKENLKGYRCYPHKLKGEGFFLSVLKKELKESSIKKLKIRKKINEIKSDNFSMVINNPDAFIFFEHNSDVFAFPRNWVDELNYLSDKINIIYAGVETGKIAGRDFIPAHALALSTIVSEHISSVECLLVKAGFDTCAD
jgi:hypothetical protein